MKQVNNVEFVVKLNQIEIQISFSLNELALAELELCSYKKIKK